MQWPCPSDHGQTASDNVRVWAQIHWFFPLATENTELDYGRKDLCELESNILENISQVFLFPWGQEPRGQNNGKMAIKNVTFECLNFVQKCPKLSINVCWRFTYNNFEHLVNVWDKKYSIKYSKYD